MKKILAICVLVMSVFTLSAQDAAQKINDANDALKNKEYAKAFELYKSALNNLGDVEVDASINYNVGFAAYQANKYQEAIEYFNKAIEASANISKSHEFIANAYTKLKQYKNAVASYEKAIETDKSGGESLFYNAAIAAYKGKIYDKAAVLFQKAVDAGYKAANALYYKAVVLKKMNKDDEYKQTLIEGAEKFPSDSKIRSALAKLYVSEGNSLYKQGVEILNVANKKVSEGALKTDAAAYTAEVEKAKAEFKKAAEVLKKAKALDASNKNAQKLLDACNRNMNL